MKPLVSLSLKADLELLRIIRPCPKKWEEMAGNDQKRFCEHCNLHVHNLSALTPRQIQNLAQTSGRRCVAYLETPDGNIQTRSRFEPLRRPFFRGCRLLASFLALIFPFSFIGCATKNPPLPTGTSQFHETSPKAVPAPGQTLTRGETKIAPPPEPRPVLLGTPIPPPPK